jgi:hypothetical protein
MPILVSEAVATAMFTVTRILYDSVLGVIALILFSKLPGGSSAKFWYEQPDIVSKITSIFDPYGPTGKRGVKSTNFIAMLCMFAALVLNVLPTLLSKLSPITVITTPGPTNTTLSRISNVFIPTLTDINVPRLSQPAYSLEATNKFLCGYIPNGCRDAKNEEIASIVWDNKTIEPVAFQHINSDSNSSLLISINDVFSTATTPQQYMFIAKDLFINQYLTELSQQWSTNISFSALYLSNNSASDQDEYSMLAGDQLHPLNTPDLADLLRQGRRRGETLDTNGTIDRAERWTAIHRTANLSTVLWQSVNAHAGSISSSNSTSCFFCQLIGVDSTTAASMQRQVDNNAVDASSSFVALQTTIDADYRLTTSSCILIPNRSYYWCLHSFTQLWNVYHDSNPYSFILNYEDVAAGANTNEQFTSTPFPFFPPPPNLTDERTYVPIVPIFEMRSKDQCYPPPDFSVPLQQWISECAANKLSQPSLTELNGIAFNIWQLGSTMTVSGFLVTAKYTSYTVGIFIGTAVQVIMLTAVGLCFIGQLVLNLVTSPVHRRSLYEVLRMMIPDSRDPYNVQRVLLDMAPTNTLRMVDSVFEKRVAYLKLNNRLIVTLSEDQTPEDDYMSKKELQDWSKRQLVKI